MTRTHLLAIATPLIPPLLLWTTDTFAQSTSCDKLLESGIRMSLSQLVDRELNQQNMSDMCSRMSQAKGSGMTASLGAAYQFAKGNGAYSQQAYENIQEASCTLTQSILQDHVHYESTIQRVDPIAAQAWKDCITLVQAIPQFTILDLTSSYLTVVVQPLAYDLSGVVLDSDDVTLTCAADGQPVTATGTNPRSFAFGALTKGTAHTIQCSRVVNPQAACGTVAAAATNLTLRFVDGNGQLRSQKFGMGRLVGTLNCPHPSCQLQPSPFGVGTASWSAGVPGGNCGANGGVPANLSQNHGQGTQQGQDAAQLTCTGLVPNSTVQVAGNIAVRSCGNGLCVPHVACHCRNPYDFQVSLLGTTTLHPPFTASGALADDNCSDAALNAPFNEPVTVSAAGSIQVSIHVDRCNYPGPNRCQFVQGSDLYLIP